MPLRLRDRKKRRPSILRGKVDTAHSSLRSSRSSLRSSLVSLAPLLRTRIGKSIRSKPQGQGPIRKEIRKNISRAKRGAVSCLTPGSPTHTHFPSRRSLIRGIKSIPRTAGEQKALPLGPAKNAGLSDDFALSEVSIYPNAPHPPSGGNIL